MSDYPDEIKKYLRLSGKQGAKNLTYLSQTHGMIAAFNTDIGRELLSDIASSYEETCFKILDDNTPVEDIPDLKAKRKALDAILNKWSTKITQYFNILDTVKKDVSNT